MRSWGRMIVLLGAVFGVAFVSQLWAQGYKKDEEKLRFYVVAERRGLDLTTNTFTALEQVKQRTAQLDAEAVQTRVMNAQLTKEIADLKRKLPGLKAARGIKRTDAEKAQVQQEIDDIEASIKDKEGQIKPPVVYIVSRAFSKPEDANNLIQQYEAEAAAAKAAAQKGK